MMNIKNEKGVVTYVMRTGGTFVRSKMSLAQASVIVKTGDNVEETDKRGYGVEICVDDTYFFPVEKKAKKKVTEETEETEKVTEETTEVAENE